MISDDLLRHNMDQFFLVIMGMCVMFMQCGFAFLEAGAVRSKNVTNILIKNVFDCFVSGVAYWLFGYAFAFGEGNKFIGYKHFASHELPESEYASFFFQYTFAATAATIVSGAVAERCEFIAYFVYSFFITGFIYPVVTHWQWGGGFLAEGKDYSGDIGTVAYVDFAGSGLVHVLGGVAAFCGALFLGPRIGRFHKETKMAIPIRGHSVPIAALGGFILFFGFLAFNGGSQTAISSDGDGAAIAALGGFILFFGFLAFNGGSQTAISSDGDGAAIAALGGFILFFGFLAFNGGSQTAISSDGDGAAVSRAVVNTVISASFAAFSSLMINRINFFGTARWSLLVTINGALTGMVAACAGCDAMYPWSACLLGTVSGIVFHFYSFLMKKIRVDDPLDAVAVHFGGGTWGVIAIAFLHKDMGIVFEGNEKSGLFLAWQLAGLAVIIAWTGVLCSILFGILKLTGFLRVPEDMELKGLDIPKHNEPAYPLEAYGHGHIEKILQIIQDNPTHVTQQHDNKAYEREMTNTGPYEHPEVKAYNIKQKNGTTPQHNAQNDTAVYIPAERL